MGKVMDMALEMKSREELKVLNSQMVEQRVHQAMMEFDGINGLSISGRRNLFQGLKLICRAEVTIEGSIILYYFEGKEIKKGTFFHPWAFECRFAQLMVQFL